MTQLNSKKMEKFFASEEKNRLQYSYKSVILYVLAIHSKFHEPFLRAIKFKIERSLELKNHCEMQLKKQWETFEKEPTLNDCAALFN